MESLYELTDFEFADFLVFELSLHLEDDVGHVAVLQFDQILVHDHFVDVEETEEHLGYFPKGRVPAT